MGTPGVAERVKPGKAFRRCQLTFPGRFLYWAFFPSSSQQHRISSAITIVPLVLRLTFHSSKLLI